MKLKFLAVILIALVLWIPYEAAYVYRLSSRERVMTKGAVQLSAGINHLYLSLPRGAYVCAFSNTPDLKPSFSASPSVHKAIHTDTTILRDGRPLVPKSNAQWLKFHVKNDSYSVVEIETAVQQESGNPVYLIVGGTF